MEKKGGIVGGSLLIAGTAIGAGMLGLPVATAWGGFWPSLFVFFLCWIFMGSTGLLTLEAALWMDRDTNLVSMAEKTLGKPGKIGAWGLYLFLFYTLSVAYISAGGQFIEVFTAGAVKGAMAALLFVTLLGWFVFKGAWIVDRLNSVMMLGLVLSYLGFVWLGFDEVDPDHFGPSRFSLAFLSLPVAFTSFAYQGTIPTLVRYLDRDRKKLYLSVVIGSFIPLLAYGVWQAFVHGIVPHSALLQAARMDQSAIIPLSNALSDPRLPKLAEAFTFFAVVTSFLGVTLGLRDFLADGLQVEKTVQGRILLSGLVFAPPVVISLSYPNIFLTALGLAGGFGCAILLGLFPILMVWQGRYVQHRRGTPLVRGGKPFLALLILFVIFEVGCQIAHLLAFSHQS